MVIVLHPLSGRRDATAFRLEAGRLCVLTSRHRHACIVVAGAGIPGLPGAYPSVGPVHLGVPAKFPGGREASQAMMRTCPGTASPPDIPEKRRGIPGVGGIAKRSCSLEL